MSIWKNERLCFRYSESWTWMTSSIALMLNGLHKAEWGIMMDSKTRWEVFNGQPDALDFT